jgi:SAM-dependent methyltransferase
VALSDLFSRRRKEHTDPEAGAAGPVHATKALARFVSSLTGRSQSVLLDLGPVVGSNLSFFGEELGCKIIVENLYKDVEHHAGELLEKFPAFLTKRFPQESASVDGILCWDLFDYLDKPSAQSLANQLVRLLRPDGVLLAFFGTVEPRPGQRPEYIRHVVVDRTNLLHRTYPAARAKQRPLPNRDIQRLFEPLRVDEQFLLKTNLREVLFRKPAETSGPETVTPSA